MPRGPDNKPRKKRARRLTTESIAGQKFGKLTIVRLVEFRLTAGGREVPIVECLCECGNSKLVSIWDLRNGNTKTCRVKHPIYEDRSMPAFNNIYDNSYRKRAIKAGLEFSITREQFRELSQQDCHYCGMPPQSISHRNAKSKRGACRTGVEINQFIYNGLDRMDSSKGYTIDNVVPCCGICNHAKHTMGYAEFTAWLDRIAEFRNVALTRAQSTLIFVESER